MSMDLLNRPPSRPKRAVTIADRAVRLQAAVFCASHVPKILQLYAEWMQQAVKVDLIINMKTAKTLGLTIPLPLLGRADEVIE
jgi:hypothetical protein